MFAFGQNFITFLIGMGIFGTGMSGYVGSTVRKFGHNDCNLQCCKLLTPFLSKEIRLKTDDIYR